MGNKREPVEDDGTKYGYYLARSEQRRGVTPSDEEVNRRRTERTRREAEEKRQREDRKKGK